MVQAVNNAVITASLFGSITLLSTTTISFCVDNIVTTNDIGRVATIRIYHRRVRGTINAIVRAIIQVLGSIYTNITMVIWVRPNQRTAIITPHARGTISVAIVNRAQHYAVTIAASGIGNSTCKTTVSAIL